LTNSCVRCGSAAPSIPQSRRELRERCRQAAYGRIQGELSTLLYEALRRSAYVSLAQLTMHSREHLVLLRPGRFGLLLHTLFYSDEVLDASERRQSAHNIVNSCSASLGFPHSLSRRRGYDYSFAYSALACLRTGRSASASFQRVRKTALSFSVDAWCSRLGGDAA
jgi:hypothetical protein